MNILIDGLFALDSTLVLLLSSLCVLVLNLILLRRNRNRQADAELVRALQRDLRALTSASVGMGERVMDMERRQRVAPASPVAPPVSPLPAASKKPAFPLRPYESAIRLVQQGAGVDELVSSCGISISEAELIRTMHRLDKAG